MEIVDSKERKLRPNEIATMHAKYSNPEAPLAQSLVLIAKLTAEAEQEPVQFGTNTIYQIFKSKDDKAFGFILNVDTPENFAESARRFIRFMRQRGLSIFVADLAGDNALNMFRAAEKLLEDDKGGVVLRKLESSEASTKPKVAGKQVYRGYLLADATGAANA